MAAGGAPWRPIGGIDTINLQNDFEKLAMCELSLLADTIDVLKQAG
ncbi:MAG TPA: hypothetical protein VFT99_03590 [Roseiflexaceae bacterium]|nr:hypothetical protein [Roseiflexaceae bacterium]